MAAAVLHSRQHSNSSSSSHEQISGGIGSALVASSSQVQSRRAMDRFHRVFLGTPASTGNKATASTSSVSSLIRSERVYVRTDGVTMYPVNDATTIRPVSPYSHQSSSAASSVTSVHNNNNNTGMRTTLHRTASGRSSNNGAGSSRGMQKPTGGYSMTRQRSRTEGVIGLGPRNASQGGIGESPAPSHRSRQNSSSSSIGSQHLSNSIFSHRQSASSATQDLVSKHGTVSGSASGIANNNSKHASTFPSIRGYTSFPDNRPRTPLTEPFALARDSGAAPQITSDVTDSNEGYSYVASLGMAPLVTRPPQGGESVYIPASSSAGASPQLHFSPRQESVNQLPSAFDSSPNPGVTATQSSMFLSSTARRPTLRQRSSSHNSYLRRSQEAQRNSEQQQQQRRDRQNSQQATTNSRSRPTSRNTNISKSKTRVGSRFITYEESIGTSPRSAIGSARNRSASFGAGGTGRQRQGEPDWSPQANTNQTNDNNNLEQQTSRGTNRGRRSRSRNREKDDTTVDGKKRGKKLVSARLPRGHPNHRDARLPSQPLGLTWVCGARLVARDPEFYDEFEYSAYPGGRRKRSSSRSTITPSSYRQSQEGTTVPGSATTVGYESEPEDRRRARQANVEQYRELHSTPAIFQQHQNPTQYTNAPIMVMSASQQALRKKSQSLTNIRRAAAENDGSKAGGLLISAPISPQQRSGEFSRTPRSAPSPYGSSDGHEGPSSMAFVSAPLAGGARGVGANSASLRKIPSKASVEAIEDPIARREALFAALPPPSRRPSTTTTNNNALSQLFSTGRVISNTVPQAQHSHQGSTAVSTEGILDDLTGDGDANSTMEDLRDEPAVILGESVLSPVVFGRAFSTQDGPHSHEGEIISGQKESPQSNSNRQDSQGGRRNMGRRNDSEGSMGQRSLDTPLSHTHSVSSGSAHVLDLHDDSFTNLFYKAPPPAKPLPSLPSSGSSLSGTSGSQRYSPVQATRHYLGVNAPASASRAGSDSPERILTGLSPASAIANSESRPTSEMTNAEQRFSTPSIFNNPLFMGGTEATAVTASDEGHSFGGASASAEGREVLADSAPSEPSADDWINVDEGLLRGNRRMWLGSQASDDEDEENQEEVIRPRLGSRGMTVTTEGDDSREYYSVPASANASTVALTEGESHVLHHAPSFVSAVSHITGAQSAAPTVQSDTPGFERQFDFMTAGQQAVRRPSKQGEDDLAALRTDLSPIFVARTASPSSTSQHYMTPAVTRPSGQTAAPTANRESFIDWSYEEPEFPPSNVKRASIDNRSFIDDDDSEDEDVSARQPGGVGHRRGLKPQALVLAEQITNRPSVIIERAPEEEEQDGTLARDDTVQHGLALSPSRSSPFTPTSPSADSAYSEQDSQGGEYRRSEILDQYPQPGGQPFGNFNLGVPAGKDRTSGVSHAHTASNVSMFSKLGDFPDVPQGQVNASASSLELDVDPAVGSTRTPRGSVDANAGNLIGVAHSTDEYSSKNNAEYEETSSDGRRSFLDTTTSPERGAQVRGSQSYMPFSSGANTPNSPTSPTMPSSSSPSSTPSFRLSGLFSRTKQHERPGSDPSSIGLQGRHSPDERRQSWKS